MFQLGNLALSIQGITESGDLLSVVIRSYPRLSRQLKGQSHEILRPSPPISCSALDPGTTICIGSESSVRDLGFTWPVYFCSKKFLFLEIWFKTLLFWHCYCSRHGFFYIRGWMQLVLAPNDLFSWNNKYNKYMNTMSPTYSHVSSWVMHVNLLCACLHLEAMKG